MPDVKHLSLPEKRQIDYYDYSHLTESRAIDLIVQRVKRERKSGYYLFTLKGQKILFYVEYIVALKSVNPVAICNIV